MGQRTATFEEAVPSVFNNMMRNVYTSVPGIVVSVVNDGTQTINVKPTINARSIDGEVNTERPSIINVQYHNPMSGFGGLSFPVKAGDPVLLIFSMRGLDVWRSGDGNSSPPSDTRMFDMNDCIAIPGITPPGVSKSSPNSRSHAHDPNDVVLVHNLGQGNEVEIRLKKSGDVIINTPGNIIVNADENAEVNCTEAIVNAESKVEINTETFEINTTNFEVNTVNYSLIATGDNVSQGNFNFDGQFILNGTHVENHTHGGVQEGGSRTDAFGD